MFEHACDTWKIYRVAFKPDVRNTGSRAAIERLGGRLEGIRRTSTDH